MNKRRRYKAKRKRDARRKMRERFRVSKKQLAMLLAPVTIRFGDWPDWTE